MVDRVDCICLSAVLKAETLIIIPTHIFLSSLEFAFAVDSAQALEWTSRVLKNKLDILSPVKTIKSLLEVQVFPISE